MIVNEKKLEQFFKKLPIHSVYYFYSTELYLVNKAAKMLLTALSEEDSEPPTVLAGPAPSVEEIVLAAGTISFFGNKRIVEMPLVQPSAFSEKDFKEFCQVLESTENAIFVLTSTFEDTKAMGTKRAKTLIQAIEKIGIAMEIAPLGSSELVQFVMDTAKELDTSIDKNVAQILLDRCGTDLFLLKEEIQKLAAASGYTTITGQLVSDMAVRNIEADVFEMVRMVQSGKQLQAFERLQQLLFQQNDPIAIAGALSSSYIDMYRVKCGQKVGRNYTQVHKDFAYKGSDWRLKKASQTASTLKIEQLEEILRILLELDTNLKRSPIEESILLETALTQIIQAERKY